MARGEMVRFMAENQIKNPADLRDFMILNFNLSQKLVQMIIIFLELPSILVSARIMVLKIVRLGQLLHLCIDQ